jgi:hypothetical protein
MFESKDRVREEFHRELTRVGFKHWTGREVVHNDKYEK